MGMMSKDNKPYIDQDIGCEDKFLAMNKKYKTIVADKEGELLKLDNEI